MFKNFVRVVDRNYLTNPMPSPKETLEIENVVASTGIEQELDLDQLGDDLAGTDYDPDEFPGLIYRIQSPQSSGSHLPFRENGLYWCCKC